jgi:ureidoglycolate lyase
VTSIVIRISAQPLEQARFAPFGEVLSLPDAGGRLYYDAALSSLRRDAWPSLSIAQPSEPANLPFTVKVLERHQFSSQSFVPINAKRWLVVVAPHAPEGGPDVSRMQAFVARGDQGVTFAADVWHHPLTVLDEAASFALFMWRNKTASDEEILDLANPVTVS